MVPHNESHLVMGSTVDVARFSVNTVYKGRSAFCNLPRISWDVFLQRSISETSQCDFQWFKIYQTDFVFKIRGLSCLQKHFKDVGIDLDLIIQRRNWYKLNGTDFVVINVFNQVKAILSI